MSREANRRAILACINDFEDPDQLADFLEHCGVSSDDIARHDGDVAETVLAHYETPGGYDIDAAAHDLATWPPIAKRIAESRREQHG
jgi:hypothetical protein